MAKRKNQNAVALGRLGGRVGGKSTSPAKRKAGAENLKKARAAKKSTHAMARLAVMNKDPENKVEFDRRMDITYRRSVPVALRAFAQHK